MGMGLAVLGDERTGEEGTEEGDSEIGMGGRGGEEGEEGEEGAESWLLVMASVGLVV